MFEMLDNGVGTVILIAEIIAAITAIAIVGRKFAGWLTLNKEEILKEVRENHECTRKLENRTENLEKIAEINNQRIQDLKESFIEHKDTSNQYFGKIDEHTRPKWSSKNTLNYTQS